MNPERELLALEELLDELLRGIQDTLQSGEVLSDDFQMLLAQELDATVSRIDELRGIIQATPAPHPEINQAMPSSNVEGFAYDRDNERLYVRFLGEYPNRNGPIYQYEGVPKVIFDLFRNGSIPARTNGKNRWGKWWKGKTPSMGASLYTLIKAAGYPYQRLTR